MNQNHVADIDIMPNSLVSIPLAFITKFESNPFSDEDTIEFITKFPDQTPGFSDQTPTSSNPPQKWGQVSHQKSQHDFVCLY